MTKVYLLSASTGASVEGVYSSFGQACAAFADHAERMGVDLGTHRWTSRYQGCYHLVNEANIIHSLQAYDGPILIQAVELDGKLPIV